VVRFTIHDSEAFTRIIPRKFFRPVNLSLAGPTVGCEPVAAMYNIIGKDKIYFYQSGRRMGVPNQIRIGIVMFVLTLQRAMESGYREFDFGAVKSATKPDLCPRQDHCFRYVPFGGRSSRRCVGRYNWRTINANVNRRSCRAKAPQITSGGRSLKSRRSR
jgi:Acetyltransferase (GNAT) domain